MLKDTIQDAFGQAYQAFIWKRTGAILLDLQHDTSGAYHQQHNECIRLFNELRDLSEENGKSLLFDYESAETAALEIAIETVYRQGLKDGATLKNVVSIELGVNVDEPQAFHDAPGCNLPSATV